ncbi:MAG: ECF transporter S component [Oscillospiraceae bacterium]|nr:ECF transporter S component [Oscillospiraceae bacterium]
MQASISTRKLVAMGTMAALSVALVFLVHFPVFPQAPFLEYDPADIPILIVSFAYGPLAGLIVTAIAAVVQGLTVSAQSGVYGIIMHLLSTGSYVLAAGLVYRAKNSRLGAIAALVCGVLASAAVMAAANLAVTPLFMGVPVEAVKAMLLPVIIPFNLIKSGSNAALMALIYLPLRPALEKFLKGR